MSDIKFGPDRFMRFDVSRSLTSQQTNKQTVKQCIYIAWTVFKNKNITVLRIGNRL